MGCMKFHTGWLCHTCISCSKYFLIFYHFWHHLQTMCPQVPPPDYQYLFCHATTTQPLYNNIFPNIFSDLSVSHLVYNFYFFTNNWRFPIFICGLKQRVIITRWALTLFDRTYWHKTAIQRINFSKYSLSNVSRMGINSSATYSLTWTKDSSRSQDSIIWKKYILCNPNNSSAITPEERRV